MKELNEQIKVMQEKEEISLQQWLNNRKMKEQLMLDRARLIDEQMCMKSEVCVNVSRKRQIRKEDQQVCDYALKQLHEAEYHLVTTVRDCIGRIRELVITHQSVDARSRAAANAIEQFEEVHESIAAECKSQVTEKVRSLRDLVALRCHHKLKVQDYTHFCAEVLIAFERCPEDDESRTTLSQINNALKKVEKYLGWTPLDSFPSQSCDRKTRQLNRCDDDRTWMSSANGERESARLPPRYESALLAMIDSY